MVRDGRFMIILGEWLGRAYGGQNRLYARIMRNLTGRSEASILALLE
jgi:hypothetical protein